MLRGPVQTLIISLILPIGLTIGPALLATGEEYLREEREHWSFLPRQEADLPTFSDPQDRSWIGSPVDAFVLAAQRARGLRPAPEAARVTLVRRLFFQVTGLPPSPAATKAFVDDPAPDAYERLVDRLLANPHYGEHWGQHWLDVVRYAETEGFEYDRYRPGAWRFRDYVIRSLNADMPYDQFVAEQLAGDELRPDDHAALVAAGFHRLGPVRRNAGNAEVAFSRNEVLTERTNAVGTTFLGLTVGCARCHDHMFDPIRQADYYRLQAFLSASFETNIELASDDLKRDWEARNKAASDEIDKLKEQLKPAKGEEEERLLALLKDAQARTPKPLSTISTVRNDAEKRTPIHLLARGDPSKKKQLVTMRALGTLLPEGAQGLPDETPNPKSHLAAWITDKENPLTARVIANRLWLYHFGTGLVATPNDFGVNGDQPSHPELLDFLANRLIEHDWQLKPIHRLILLSNTYRQSSRSTTTDKAFELDPANRLLWRFPRRRLAAEEIRDAMLAISGELNLKASGPSVIVPVDQELVDLLYAPSQWEVTANEVEHLRRSVYLIAKRNLRLPFMEVFDQPDLQTSCARRESSTHAPQSLELLNGKLSNQLAEVFARRLDYEAGASQDMVALAFALTASRPPSDRERAIAVEFLAQNSLHEFALAMFNLNAFLYVE
jgi:hypothetical protein